MKRILGILGWLGVVLVLAAVAARFIAPAKVELYQGLAIAGLLATAGDYARLLEMLRNHGELDGVRLLSPKTVELMHANHTGAKYAQDTGAFGLGFWVMQDVGYYGELGTPGAYGWGSAYFPQYLVDPQERIVALLMTQLRPSGGNDLSQKFKVLMYQALVK